MDSQERREAVSGWPHPPAESNVELVEDHVTRFLGKGDFVWHELISHIVHIDVHHIPPIPGERDYQILYTTGMSDRPMTVPEGEEEFRNAELMLYLPPTWDLDRLRDVNEADDIEDVYWPIRWLKKLARFPHEYDSWLALGHTIPNGDPAEPLA